MGNQGSSSNKKDGRSKCPPEEPLESYLREKQRNDHLQNLGLKRHTSFRKSLTKRLKKRKRPPLPAALSQQQSSSQNDPPSSTTESITQVDTGGGSGGPNTSSNLHEPSPAIITSTCDIHEHPPPFRRSSHGNQQLTRSNSNPTLSSTSKVKQKSSTYTTKPILLSTQCGQKSEKKSNFCQYIINLFEKFLLTWLPTRMLSNCLV